MYMCIYIYLHLYVCIHKETCQDYTFLSMTKTKFVLDMSFIYLQICISTFICMFKCTYAYVHTCMIIYLDIKRSGLCVPASGHSQVPAGYVVHICMYIYLFIDICTPHETLLGIQRVLNPSTKKQRISNPAHSNG